jgi:hypothetical protein
MEQLTIEQSITLLVPFLSYAGTHAARLVADALDKNMTGKYRPFLPFVSVLIGLAIVWSLQFADSWFGENAHPAIVTAWGIFSGALGVSVREMIKQSRKMLHLEE